MKLTNIYSYILLVVTMMVTGGCSTHDIESPDNPDIYGKGNVTLTFRTAKNGSRAADNSNNEDLIKSLMVFLYTDNANSEQDEPVASASFSNLDSHAVTTVRLSLTDEQTERLFPEGNDSECRLVALANLPANTLLPESKTIANLRQLSITSNFNSQQGRVAQTSFIMFGDTHEGREGTVKVKYTEGDFGGTAQGNVILVRAAARITLNVRVPASIEVDGETADTKVTWVSQASNMQVLLENGVYESLADPSVTTDRPDSKSYFSISEGKNYKFIDSGVTDETAYRWQQTLPFYTYPNKWESSPGEIHKTTMVLIVPWQREGTQTYRTCYYKVPVTSGTELLRNTAYTVNLNVGMLGSFIKEEPLVVEASYFTVDWEAVETPVAIKDYRYLVVNQNNYVVDNQSTISIPFFSSHEVEVSNISMTYQRFNMYGNDGEVMDIPITMAQNEETGIKNNGQKLYTYELTSDAMGNNVLTINHPLTPWQPRKSDGSTIAEKGYLSKTDAEDAINQISYYMPATGQAYSPYVITVTIKHKDMAAGSAFEQTMTVTQYPGMWILADQNPGTPSNRPQTNAQRGFVYVNGKTETGSQYGGIHGLTGTNKNPNMYVITINTLDAEQQRYIIDDPRYFIPINLGDNSWTEGSGWISRTYYYLTGTNNLNDAISAPEPGSKAASELSQAATWSESANALYRGNELTSATGQHLTYYYPTNEGDEFKNVIAPKIRVASSYGVTSDVQRNAARRRCASYQEAGRPAGRWRLPTLGEMEFIVNLSRTGKIPELFTTGNGYWSAQGYVAIPAASNSSVTLNAVNSNSVSRPVRCVYDEWFWEQFIPAYNNSFSSYYNTFTWGDRPKANPEELPKTTN